uniref:General transcription factor IIH subunit 4 n=1 Tax=Macrostomum lignano TaxID=282301 RepID=A0A1I8JN61_9PLAT
ESLRRGLQGGGQAWYETGSVDSAGSDKGGRSIEHSPKEHWDSLLQFMVNSRANWNGAKWTPDCACPAVAAAAEVAAAASDEDDDEDDDGEGGGGGGRFTVGESGFRFLLLDQATQVQTIVVHYLRAVQKGSGKMAGIDLSEAINLLFQLSSATLGRSYPTACLPSPSQQSCLRHCRALGLVYWRKRYPGRFYPTRLATRATSGRLGLADSTGTRTHSCGRDSCQPCIPPTVCDQMLLWERERNRFTFTDSVLYEKFANKRDYQAVKSYASDCGVLLHSVDDRMILVVTNAGHDDICRFYKRYKQDFRNKTKHENSQKEAAPDSNRIVKLFIIGLVRIIGFRIVHLPSLPVGDGEAGAVAMPTRAVCLGCLMQACSGDWCSLACPLCRRRLSVWMRRARNPELLVNQDKWRRIQQLHPRLVEVVEAGGSADNGAERRQLAQPGELQAEWQAAVDALTAERRAQQATEEAASLRADSPTAPGRSYGDSDVTGGAAAWLRISLWLTSEPGDPLAAPPIRRHDSDESSAIVDNRCRLFSATAAAYLRCDSVDSIGPELNQHFRPIQAMPLTPTKPANSTPASTASGSAATPGSSCAAAAAAALISGGGRPRRLLRSASVQETASTSSTTSTKPSSRCLRSQMSVVVESPAATAGLEESLLVEAESCSGGSGGYSLRKLHQQQQTKFDS